MWNLLLMCIDFQWSLYYMSPVDPIFHIKEHLIKSFLTLKASLNLNFFEHKTLLGNPKVQLLWVV